jgi:hypothetical protein
MDKVLYRLMLGLACLILVGFLILVPVFSGMYTDMVRREKRIIEAETRIDKKIKQLEQSKGE